MSNFLESSTVEEFKPNTGQNPSDFDWVIIMGFLNDEQISQLKEILSSTQCTTKVRYAKRVFYKGFRSCLLECVSSEDSKVVLEFILNN